MDGQKNIKLSSLCCLSGINDVILMLWSYIYFVVC